MFGVFCPVACEGVLVVVEVVSFERLQELQLEAVRGLQVRAARRRVLREELEGEDREYAREWGDALKLELTEGALGRADLEAPNVPARQRAKGSRSRKESVRQPKELGVGGDGQGSSAG